MDSLSFDNSYCCVPQCVSKGMDKPRPSFHKFPRNLEYIKLWTIKFKIGKPVTSGMLVCSKHFAEEDFNSPAGLCLRRKLKSNVIPSLNLPLSSVDTEEKRNRLIAIRKKRQMTSKEINRKKQENKNLQESAMEVGTNENLQESSLMEVCTNENLQESSLMEVCTNENLQESAMGACTNKNLQELAMEADINEENERITVAEALLQLSTFLPESVKNQNSPQFNDACVGVCSGDLHIRPLRIEALSEKSLNSITGIHSLKLLNALVELIEWKYPRKRSNHILSIKEEVIITMMRIRINLKFVVLAALFSCSPKTCRNIFADIVPKLAVILQPMIKVPSSEEISKNIPKCFEDFLNVKMVIDCTEVLVSKPKCLKCRINTYSNYYKDHTVKGMLCISPGGIFTFVSSVYGGRASDKCIFKESNVIKTLNPFEDSIMADKGFLINDICEENYVKFIQPPFLKKGQKQFSATDSKSTKSIAAARVHVERCIQRFKVFELLGSKIPWNLLPFIDDIFIIAAGLANLGAPVLADVRFTSVK